MQASQMVKPWYSVWACCGHYHFMATVALSNDTKRVSTCSS